MGELRGTEERSAPWVVCDACEGNNVLHRGWMHVWHSVPAFVRPGEVSHGDHFRCEDCGARGKAIVDSFGFYLELT